MQNLEARMAYNLKKAQLMAKMSMSSQKRLPQRLPQLDTVTKPVRKAPKKSAQQLAKIKGLKKKKMHKVDLELPKAPAGTSTARRLQDPRHSDIVRGLVNVPSLQDMGLKKDEGAEHYPGSLYYRYCVQTGYMGTAGIVY